MQLQAGVDVGLVAALLAGLLTLLSPCSVMLLPAFFSAAFGDPRRLLGRTAVFYLGLATVLVPMGVAAATLGGVLVEHRSAIVAVTAVVLVLLGCGQALSLRLPGRTAGPARSTSAVSVYLLGTVYGVSGACSGPLLGAVLAYAAFGAGPAYGGTLMAFFAAGMAIPLLLLALVWRRSPGARVAVRPRPLVVGPVRTTWAQVAGGTVTIAIGVVLLLTDGFAEVGGLGSVGTQAWFEERASDLARHASDRTLLGALLILVALLGIIRFLRSAPHRDPDA